MFKNGLQMPIPNYTDVDVGTGTRTGARAKTRERVIDRTGGNRFIYHTESNLKI
jgi:hypothetical protein